MAVLTMVGCGMGEGADSDQTPMASTPDATASQADRGSQLRVAMNPKADVVSREATNAASD
jgi:hypothetical protein